VTTTPVITLTGAPRPRLATIEERRLLSLPQVSVMLEPARTVHDADHQPVLS